MSTAKKSSPVEKVARPRQVARGVGASTPTAFAKKGGGRTVRPAGKVSPSDKGAQVAGATRELLRTAKAGALFTAGTPAKARAPAAKPTHKGVPVRQWRDKGGVWEFLTPEFGQQVAPPAAAALDRETTRTLIKNLGLVFGPGRVRLVPEGILIATGSAVDGDRPMTTQEAADLLGVSRPFLAKQVDAGRIALHLMAGNQRRVLRKDVLAWHAKLQTERRVALTELGALLDEEFAD